MTALARGDDPPESPAIRGDPSPQTPAPWRPPRGPRRCTG